MFVWCLFDFWGVGLKQRESVFAEGPSQQAKNAEFLSSSSRCRVRIQGAAVVPHFLLKVGL